MMTTQSQPNPKKIFMARGCSRKSSSRYHIFAIACPVQNARFAPLVEAPERRREYHTGRAPRSPRALLRAV